MAAESTPFRKTHFRTDIGVPHVAEPPFSFGRKGGEIQRGTKTKTGSVDVKLLATGAWCESPFQDKPNYEHRSDNGGGQLRLSDFNTSADMAERAMFRSPSDLSGVTVSGNVISTGNYYLVRNVDVSASSAWAKSLTADATALPAPTLPEGADVSKSRKAVSKATYGIYQGWQINLFVPASQGLNKAQFLFGFSFNAPPSDTAGATGVYYLAFLYSGTALLYEQISTSGNLTWSAAYEWLYAPVTRNFGLNFICRIIPHVKPSVTSGQGINTSFTGYLLFQMDAGEIAPGVVADPFSKLSTPAGGHHGYSSVYTYNLKKGFNLITDSPGAIRVDMPDDGKTPFQIMQIKYPATATLIDFPFYLPWAQSQAANFRFYWNIWLPLAALADASGMAFDGKLYDATTNAELTQVGGGSGYKEYQVNVRQPHYYAKFTFTGSSNQNYSAFLWNYKIVRDSVYISRDLADISIPEDYPLAGVTSVSHTGAEKDVTHESCSITIEDPGSNLAYPFTLRAGGRSQIWSSYDPSNPGLRSIYFDGYVDRAETNRKGSIGTSFPLWNSYDVRFNAMWVRLKKTLTSQIYMLQSQSGTNPGTFTFDKVTDLCRALIATAGFSDDQIDIPDSPITFLGQNGNTGYLDSLSPVLDTVAKFLQDYLGWYLAWCPNSGASGMWRAIQPVPLFAGYTSLATFTYDYAVGKAQFRPESYGTPNWVTKSDGTIPVAPIRKKTLHYFPVLPEGNSVFVTATSDLTSSTDGTKRVQNEVRNLKSYDSIFKPDPVITSDPFSQDYIGWHQPIFVVIFGLQQNAVDAICRRVYDVACHGYEVFTFQAPLVLVTDPADMRQVNPRPLRYYDPVTVVVDGNPIQFLVRNVNIIYKKDGFQFAHYELQTPYATE